MVGVRVGSGDPDVVVGTTVFSTSAGIPDVQAPNIAAEVAKGVAQTALQYQFPVAFGVLTTETLEQALERAGTKAGNKGWDAAISAIEMADLWDKL